jgi:hypothetical protein
MLMRRHDKTLENSGDLAKVNVGVQPFGAYRNQCDSHRKGVRYRETVKEKQPLAGAAIPPVTGPTNAPDPDGLKQPALDELCCLFRNWKFR